MPLPQDHRRQGPRCWDRIKMGFMMGFTVGLASGILLGGFNGLRYGLRGMELVRTIGKGSIQGGAVFGTFMAVGSGIRC